MNQTFFNFIVFKKISFSDLNALLRNYCPTIRKDPDFGAVLINYFGYSDKRNFDILTTNHNINANAFMHYINILIAHKENVSHQRLTNVHLNVI